MKNEIVVYVNSFHSSDQTLKQSEASKLCVSNCEQYSLGMPNLAARKFNEYAQTHLDIKECICRI